MAGRGFDRTIVAGALALMTQAAQADVPRPLAGTYNGSEMEVGTELRLEANGRYQYYLSYGALDETSQGTWTADRGGITLTSDAVKAPQFELVETKLGKGKELVVSLDTPEQLPLQLFSVFLVQPDGNVAEVPFEDGPLHIPMKAGKAPSEMAIALPVYQVASQPYALSPGRRTMHFRFVPNDLGKVAFNHYRLAWDGQAFVLKRFDRVLRFRKEVPQNQSQGAQPD